MSQTQKNTTALELTIRGVKNNEVVNRQQLLTISIATDETAEMAWVEYLLDGKEIARSVTPPFEVTIDLSAFENGEHKLKMVAYGTNGEVLAIKTLTFILEGEEAETEGSLPGDEQNSLGQGLRIVTVHTPSPASGGNTPSPGSDPPDDNGNNGNGGGEEETPNPPTEPLAQICGNNDILGGGPATPPPGAFVVPAGDNESLNLHQANTTYWFAPGVHTLGTDQFGQIIPGDNSIYIGAPGAVLDGQHKNRFAFTQEAQNVTIKYLEIRNFGVDNNLPGVDPTNNDEGVINHDAGVNWTVEYNYVHDNDGAGVFIGSGNKIRYNCLKDNGQYGFSAYHTDGVTNVILDHNEVVGNNQDDWETVRPFCGCTGGGKFWETNGAVITNNWIHDNIGTGIWADFNNVSFLFERNYIEENDGVGLFYEISYNFMIKNNTIKRNALIDGKKRATSGNPFPSGAIYISESGGDTRAGNLYAQSEIFGNNFEDNWDGVVLWENADRFCRPDEEPDTTNNCPFFDNTWGTRFKTQNIKIHKNEFKVDYAAIDCTNSLCGRNAVFSNYGSWPPTSPYKGTVIQEAITFHQNNHWLNNNYVGPWFFTPFEMSNRFNWEVWRATPYNQDAGSTYSN